MLPQVGYGHPQTLSDVGLKLAPGVRGDAIHLKPTFMVFPPTVLDRIRQGITAKVEAAGGIKASLFERALNDGKRDFETNKIGPPPLWNLAVFRNAQAALGGCVEVMITGSAPLSHETQRFIQTVFNCPVRLSVRCCSANCVARTHAARGAAGAWCTEFLSVSASGETPPALPALRSLLQVRQGYGLTETTCAATLGVFETNDWNVGRVLSRRAERLSIFLTAHSHDPHVVPC